MKKKNTNSLNDVIPGMSGFSMNVAILIKVFITILCNLNNKLITFFFFVLFFRHEILQ